MEHGMLAERELTQLCQSLRLQYERQDWGIVNADGQRLSEFIAYYEGNPNLSATQKFELGELILASANERLLSVDKSLPREFRPFLVRNGNAFKAHLEYWQSLQDGPEFPIASWLRIHLLECLNE